MISRTFDILKIPFRMILVYVNILKMILKRYKKGCLFLICHLKGCLRTKYHWISYHVNHMYSSHIYHLIRKHWYNLHQRRKIFVEFVFAFQNNIKYPRWTISHHFQNDITTGSPISDTHLKNQFADKLEGLRQFWDHRWKALGEENSDFCDYFCKINFWCLIFLKHEKTGSQ